jgi:hypothetical protein
VSEFDFTVNDETNTHHKEIMRIIPQNRFIQIFVSQGMDCEITPSATTVTPESDHGNPG